MPVTPSDKDITYQSYPGQTYVFSGGTLLKGLWTGPDADGVYSMVNVNLTFRDLYVGGTRATRARSALFPSGFTKTATGWTDTNSLISSLSRPQDVEIVDYVYWKFFKVRVSSAVGTTVTCRQSDFDRSQFQSPFNHQRMAWYENAKELVKNGQGYWYHDRSTGKLYYKPRPGEVMGTVEVVAGTLEQMFTYDGDPNDADQDINFRGIKFAHTTWLYPDTYGYTPIQAGMLLTSSNGSTYKKTDAGVRIRYGRGVKFWTCFFENMGGVGVALEKGSKECVLHNCEFNDIGGAAIMVGDVTDTANDPWPSDADKLEGNVIYNCGGKNTGSVYKDHVAIFLAYSKAATVDRNSFDDMPYSFIHIGWGWGYNDPPGYANSGWPATFQPAPTQATATEANTVTRNKGTNLMKWCWDGGGIYMLGDQKGAVVKWNYIGKCWTSACDPLYLDNGCQHATVEENVVESETSYYGYLQNGFDPRAKNNSFSRNYFLSGSLQGPADPSNVMDDNVVGAFGPAALAIKTDAGRI